MIGPEDIEYHVPEGITYTYAETNYFIAMIPEERILATFYTVTRKSVGVCLVDVAIYGCLSTNRGEMLYLDSQQQLPAPERLSRFETPNGLKVHAHSPAHYTLDGADGVADPKGLHAERLGVDIHVMLADGAPVRNLTEAVQNAHLAVDAVVASPLAAGYACLSAEERELGVALVEVGAQVTNVAVFAGGMLLGLATVPIGSGDITDAIASAFGIRRFQAERLKCVHGSAIASPSDHREMIPVNAPGEESSGGPEQQGSELEVAGGALLHAVVLEHYRFHPSI